MFRSFSFDPASRPTLDSDVHDLCLELSPYEQETHESPETTSELAINELQHCFNNHHISDGPLPSSYLSCLGAPELHGDATPNNTFHEMASAEDFLSSSQMNTHASHQARRAQRQIASRLQCTGDHLVRLSSLLDNMIAQGDQCYLAQPASTSARPHSSSATFTSSDLDSLASSSPSQSRRSSISSLATSSRLKFRRSGDLRDGSAAVLKPPRIRKRRNDRQTRRSL